MPPIRQPQEVMWDSGRPINWNRPPAPQAICRWSKRTSGGKPVRASFRTLCHLNRLNNLALAKYGTEIVILQSAYNTTVRASAGTHDYDACLDLYIPGVSWWEQQRFLRANGFGCWYRFPPTFGHHIHGFTLPPVEGKVRSDDFAVNGFRVGAYVPGQLEDYYNHAFGLAGRHRPGSDKTWYPADITKTIFDLDKYIQRRKVTK